VHVTHIFDGDDDVYKNLKFASDHFEHGSRGFNKVQDASARTALGRTRPCANSKNSSTWS
jgi:hypothetical protein